MKKKFVSDSDKIKSYSLGEGDRWSEDLTEVYFKKKYEEKHLFTILLKLSHNSFLYICLISDEIIEMYEGNPEANLIELLKMHTSYFKIISKYNYHLQFEQISIKENHKEILQF